MLPKIFLGLHIKWEYITLENQRCFKLIGTSKGMGLLQILCRSGSKDLTLVRLTYPPIKSKKKSCTVAEKLSERQAGLDDTN